MPRLLSADALHLLPFAILAPIRATIQAPSSVLSQNLPSRPEVDPTNFAHSFFRRAALTQWRENYPFPARVHFLPILLV